MFAADRLLTVSNLALLTLSVATFGCTESAAEDGFPPSATSGGISGGGNGGGKNNDDEGDDAGGGDEWSLDDEGGDEGLFDPDDLMGDPDGRSDCGRALIGVIRDFSQTHPDFETIEPGPESGFVAPLLGPDSKPVFVGPARSITGPDTFAQWFNDVPGTNVPLDIAIPLDDEGVYDNPRFFPADDIDGAMVGFGQEGNAHNYHFTLEIHTEFTYQGGEEFEFRGDDDLFTFVNGHLAIDLGGVHLPLKRTIVMDEVAAQFGMEIGGTYPIDFFFAERQKHLSNFRITTSIDCFTPIPIG